MSHTTDDLVFEWEEDVPLDVWKNIELPQLQLEGNYTNDCTQVYATGNSGRVLLTKLNIRKLTTPFSLGNFTCLEVVFVLKRRLGYYMFHTYIPTCLIVVMSVSYEILLFKCDCDLFPTCSVGVILD